MLADAAAILRYINAQAQAQISRRRALFPESRSQLIIPATSTKFFRNKESETVFSCMPWGEFKCCILHLCF